MTEQDGNILADFLYIVSMSCLHLFINPNPYGDIRTHVAPHNLVTVSLTVETEEVDVIWGKKRKGSTCSQLKIYIKAECWVLVLRDKQ